MRVGRLRDVVAFARRHELAAVIDNTFATPVNFRPVSLGFDLCLNSATKYLNGHSDTVRARLRSPSHRLALSPQKPGNSRQ